jgi:glycine oxidase
MRRMRGAEIVVAGAGAVGSAIAYALARAGHSVTVVDPMAANASSIAAGMLAPAFECVFDVGSAGHYPLLKQARDLWPGLAAEIGLTLACDGALAIGTEAEARVWTDRLTGLGAEARLLSPHDAGALAPGLAGGAWAALTPEDWRLDPTAALARLRDAAQAHGARFVVGRVTGFAVGAVTVDSGEDRRAERLVIATGASRDLAALAPELRSLTPIKGHILRAEGAFRAQPVVRARGFYLCMGEGEAILGATMEVGVADAAVNPEVAAGLFEAAHPLIDLLATPTSRMGPTSWSAAAGVRAATPDGLPLAGASVAAGVILAVGARRNGWLLAPLIARAVLDAVEGSGPAGAAARFDPRRLAATKPG